MKFTKVLFLTVAASCLAGCDFPFGPSEEQDVNLYSLTLKTNIEGFETPTARLKEERDEEEIQEWIDAGATREDVDKTNKLIDGKYYYFSQDAIYLDFKQVPGYQFLGWYEGNEFIGRFGTDDNNDGEPDYWWNMYDRDVVLEARFVLIDYTLLYMDEGTSRISTDNPTSWNVKQAPIELTHPEVTGKDFKGWSTTISAHQFMDDNVTKIDEEFIKRAGIAYDSGNQNGKCEIALHAIYEDAKHSFKFTFDNTLLQYIVATRTTTSWGTGTIDKNGEFVSDDSRFNDSGALNGNFVEGDLIEIYVSFAAYTMAEFKEAYDFYGVYDSNDNCVVAPEAFTGEYLDHFSVTVTKDMDLHLKYEPKC